jgi:hypothetical protein
VSHEEAAREEAEDGERLWFLSKVPPGIKFGACVRVFAVVTVVCTCEDLQEDKFAGCAVHHLTELELEECTEKNKRRAGFGLIELA